jgi:hypothetical protein
VRYILLIAVIGLLIYILFRMFKSRRDVSGNNFTPIDDLDNGLIRKSSKEPHKIEARVKLHLKIERRIKSGYYEIYRRIQ